MAVKNTSTFFTTKNPVLSLNEIGYETDTGKYKIGDGSTPWKNLIYWNHDYLIGEPFAGTSHSTLTSKGLVPKPDLPNDENHFLSSSGDWLAFNGDGADQLVATQTNNGLMSSDDKIKLDSLNYVFMYQGTVTNFTDLPKTSKIGYVYNVLNAYKPIGLKPGENVVWNGKEWDLLGGFIEVVPISEDEINALFK